MISCRASRSRRCRPRQDRVAGDVRGVCVGGKICVAGQRLIYSVRHLETAQRLQQCQLVPTADFNHLLVTVSPLA